MDIAFRATQYVFLVGIINNYRGEYENKENQPLNDNVNDNEN